MKKVKMGSIPRTLLFLVQLIQVDSWCNNTDTFLLNGWKKYDGALYKQFAGQWMTYTAWEMYCQSYGGSLATAKTAGENDIVFSRNILPSERNTWTYIGLKNNGTNWMWNDGSPAIYTNWNRNAAKYWPDACVHMYVEMTWWSIQCYHNLSGVCKCPIAVGCNATNPCSNRYADCTSGICQCRLGYTLSGTRCTAAVNSSCDTTNGCSNPYASCIGGYCECRQGYSKSGDHCKADVGTSCDTYYGCSNPGASCNGKCQCKSGYETNGSLCKAVVGTPCDQTNGCSNPYAHCTNGICDCMSGYFRNGIFSLGSTCDATNGCSSPYADCGSGTCQCRSGYTRNGTYCKADIGSKCDATNGCSNPYADCTNATCQCRSGYIQNGTLCTAVDIIQMNVFLYLLDVQYTEELQNLTSPKYTNTSKDIILKIRNILAYISWFNNSNTFRFHNSSNEITVVELNIQTWGQPTNNISNIMCTLKKLCNQANQDGSWNLYLYNLDGALLKPSHTMFLNGTDGFLTCTCMGEGLEWYYAKTYVESIIATTSNSRIQRRDQAMNSTTTSNLTFRPVLESDIGWYECRCTIDIRNVKVAGIWMAVHVPAQVIVSPLTQTVKNGSNANISCTLINNAERVSFQWFKDRIPLKNESGNLAYHLNGNISILEITNLAQPANYSCSGSNYRGSGNNATATIDVLNDEKQYCKKEIDTIGNITWGDTNSGSVNRKPCQSGFKGVVTRNCQSNGSWEDPVYDQCVNEKLLNLNTQIDQLKDGVQVTNVSTVLAGLQNATNPTAGVLRQAELNVVVSMLDKLVKVKNSTGANVSEFTDLLQIASNIIDASTSHAWTVLITKEKKGAETVMQTVEVFVSSDLNKTRMSNSSQTIHTDNIDVEIGFNSSIKFQPRRKGPSLNNKTITTSLSLYTGNMSAYAAVFFRNVSNILQKRTISDQNTFITTGRLDIGPDVMSLQLNKRPEKLTYPIQLMFEAFDTQYHTPLCSYWELNATGTGEGAWSSNNCYLVTQNSSGFVCECNHLTNFAILMTTQEFPETGHNVQLSIISAVGCAVSITCLLLTIFRHLQVWRYVKSRKTCIILNICVALIFSYGIFLAGVKRTENKAVCTSIAALLHYFYLTVFFLMLVEGIEIAVSVLFVFFNKSRLKFLSPLAWLIPAGIVVASLGISRLNGYGNDQHCWLTVRHGLIWAFVGPAALIILCNAVIIVVVIKKMFNTSAFMSKTQKDKAKTSLRSLGVLLPITGVTWILGIFSVTEDLYVFQYLFTIFNSLQWLILFSYAENGTGNIGLLAEGKESGHTVPIFLYRAVVLAVNVGIQGLATSWPSIVPPPLLIRFINSASEILSVAGLFIFIFHCLLNNQIRAAMKEKQRRKRSLETSTTNPRTASNDESRRRVIDIEETSKQIQRNIKWQAIVLQLQDFVSSSKRRTIHRSQPSDTETDCGSGTQSEYY